MSRSRAIDVQQNISGLCEAIGEGLAALLSKWTHDLEGLEDEALRELVNNDLGRCMAAHMSAAMAIGKRKETMTVTELLEMLEQTVLMGKDLAELYLGYRDKALTDEEAVSRNDESGFLTSDPTDPAKAPKDLN